MRYMPNPATDISDRFNNGIRPPMDLIPAELVKLITERDRILEQGSIAGGHARELAHESNDVAARTTDDTRAAEAARAGKPIPAASAVAKLAEAREDAARALAAQEAALVDVTNDCDTLASELYWNATDAGKAAAEARQAALAIAAKYVAVVEDAVIKRATHDWLGSGTYYSTAAVAAIDVIPDLKRRGIDRHDIKAPTVREVVAALTEAALTDNKEN